jgi:transposase
MLAVAENERPKTEVPAKAKRRRYSAEFKRRILREAAACTKTGEVSALLRREGLYSSHLTTWRHAQDRGELEGLAPKKRGPKVEAKNPLTARVAQLEAQLRRAEARAERAEAICEVQKNHRARRHLWLRNSCGSTLRRLGGVAVYFLVAPEPVKKHGPGVAADLQLVTRKRSRLGK